MSEAKVGIEYLSVGANRQTAVSDWNEDGVVAFGTDSNIALWQPNVSFYAPAVVRIYRVDQIHRIPPSRASTMSCRDTRRT
jgi:hypothetical protein